MITYLDLFVIYISSGIRQRATIADDLFKVTAYMMAMAAGQLSPKKLLIYFLKSTKLWTGRR
jgi:hypothetical protein